MGRDKLGVDKMGVQVDKMGVDKLESRSGMITMKACIMYLGN